MATDDTSGPLDRILLGFEQSVLEADDADMGESSDARAIVQNALKSYRYGSDGRRSPSPRSRSRGGVTVPAASGQRERPYQEVRATFSTGVDDDSDGIPDPSDQG